MMRRVTIHSNTRNEKQYKTNIAVLEHVGEAQDALRRSTVNQVAETLAEVSDILQKRNKLIHLADQIEAGWALVDNFFFSAATGLFLLLFIGLF